MCRTLGAAVLMLLTVQLSLQCKEFVRHSQTYLSSVMFACVPTPIMDIVVRHLFDLSLTPLPHAEEDYTRYLPA